MSGGVGTVTASAVSVSVFGGERGFAVGVGCSANAGVGYPATVIQLQMENCDVVFKTSGSTDNLYSVVIYVTY